jgi:hypothetical protein
MSVTDLQAIIFTGQKGRKKEREKGRDKKKTKEVKRKATLQS